MVMRPLRKVHIHAKIPQRKAYQLPQLRAA
jgi:hypothetical protein